MDSLQEFKDRYLQSKFSNGTIVVIVTTIRGGRKSSHERQLMVAYGEGGFDEDILTFGSLFKTELTNW
jgi:hypothetical protein